MNDYFRFIDADGIERIVNRNLISEISEDKDGCILYACGHPIKTSMKWNKIITTIFKTTQTQSPLEFLHKEKSSCNNQ